MAHAQKQAKKTKGEKKKIKNLLKLQEALFRTICGILRLIRERYD